MFGVNPHHYGLSAHDGNFGGSGLQPLVDRVVQHFGRDELDGFLGSDFDSGTSRRVAASACWTLCNFQFADAR